MDYLKSYDNNVHTVADLKSEICNVIDDINILKIYADMPQGSVQGLVLNIS